MANVVFRFEDGDQVTVSTALGENLLETARKSNVVIDAPCSGNASCGKCKVKFIKGKLDSKKTRHISDAEYEEGWRLACVSHPSVKLRKQIFRFITTFTLSGLRWIPQVWRIPCRILSV